MRSLGSTVVAAAGLASVVSAAVDPIVIKGAKFFHQSSGEQFYMKGIAYQRDYTGTTGTGTAKGGDYNDPLADPKGCKRDIPLLQELETNAIRVYALDPTQDHDDCMQQMADAGIYVLADLSAPDNGLSINRDDPEWNDDLYNRYASVIDVMAKYTNTLGFFAGNEVANAPNNTNSAPFVKAAVRDMKAYIKKQGYRDIGVGYATSDNSDIRVALAEYFNCGDQADAIDFWGYNIYEWCGDSNLQESGYLDRAKEFATYSVPSFFAEYGCNTGGSRPFTEVPALLGPQLSPVFSGGFVYMYFQEANDFGIVSIGSDDKATKLPDFTSLSQEVRKATPTGVSMNAYNPTNSPAACPTSGNGFNAQPTPLPPTPNQELCTCMYSALKCTVNPDIDEDAYQKNFNYVCGHDKAACAGIAHDSESGTYGAYGMCNAQQQLGWVFNHYYHDQNSNPSACDFNGAAQTQSGSLSSKCSGLIAEAGNAGTNTVTSQPSGTGSAGGSSSSAAASHNTVPKAQSGMLAMAVIVTLAMSSGMAMILL